MTITKVPQRAITQVIDAMQWGVSGDDAKAATETRNLHLALKEGDETQMEANFGDA